MKSSGLLTVSSLATLAFAQSTGSNTTDATVCTSGAHVIVARASLEAPGYGILVTVKDEILRRIPNSNAVAVPYPATIFGPIVYVDSEPEGVGNLTQLVTEYVDACPGHKMVLMGYSQGAQVVGDTLIGSDYPLFGSFPTNTGLAQNYVDSVAAVVMMGDPANVAGQPFLKGNSTHNGTFPRGNTAVWVSKGLVDKTVSYCDANDTFCDSGSSLAVHLSYIEQYGNATVDFVVEKFMANNSSSATTSSASSGRASTTSSATSTSSTAAPTTSSMSGASRMGSGFSPYILFGGLQCVLAFVLTLAI